MTSSIAAAFDAAPTTHETPGR
ncbi:MAG: hypothetical protein QOI81_272, partial [Actinomycetota bacterium]|nr:hypothetical protein [Actinomycetota bacterium]